MEEICRLFEPEESEIIETTYQGDKGKEKIQYRDIYFTKYAQERSPKIGGIMFESEVRKMLSGNPPGW